MVHLDLEKIAKQRRKDSEKREKAEEECIANGNHIGEQLKGISCYETGGRHGRYYFIMQCSHCSGQYEQNMTKEERADFIRRSKEIIVK